MTRSLPILVLVVAFFASCQSYDFTPVRPFAVAQTEKDVEASTVLSKPNLFLVVDTSGSMDHAVSNMSPCNQCLESTGKGCSDPSNNPSTLGCATRLSNLKDAMNTFLTGFQSGADTPAHMGMISFPKFDPNPTTAMAVCTPGSVDEIATAGEELDTSQNDDDNALRTKALNINEKISKLKPNGFTPTRQTLNGLKSYGKLIDSKRPGFVLLLTDGVPNCGNGSATTTVTDAQTLDNVEMVNTLNSLRTQNNIRTIIVGFGSELAQLNKRSVLQSFASAGGFKRKCDPATAVEDCGANNPCISNGTDTCGNTATTCQYDFFTAEDSTALSKALAQVRSAISCSDPCRFTLATQPSKPEYVSVLNNDVPLPRNPATDGQWDYLGNGIVQFNQDSKTCRDIKSATADAPVNLKFRVIETL